MSELDTNQVTGISFQHLFGDSVGELSMERVEAFLSKVVEIASEQARVDPNALVRVVHDNRITWMTQEQASEFLKSTSESATLRQDIEAALKGKLIHIRQELEILLALARYTLDKFKTHELIPAEQIQRLEPSLQRRASEIKDGVSQTAESESLVEEKRRRNPIIGQFEEMMGRFLQAKSKGNLQEAAHLAKSLEASKKHYVLFTRSLEPDIRTIYYHRLNLQKTKKRLLQTQNQLCYTRKDSLVLELNELKKNILSVKQQTQQAELDGQGSAETAIRRQDLFDLSQMKQDLSNKVCEYETLKKESEILERQESSVDAVIQTISESVLGETDAKIDVQAKLKQEQMKSAAKPATKPASKSPDAAEKKKSLGMHVRVKR